MDPIKERSADEFRLNAPIPWLNGWGRFDRLESWYKEQLKGREVDPTVWDPAAYDLTIVDKLAKILAENIWITAYQYHPDDPYFVVGGFQTGDLCEIEAIMDIEDHFGVKIPLDTELEMRVFRDWKMKDMVAFIMEHRTK